MSYEKHTWTDGELVTAAKMNNIENGIEEASSGGGGAQLPVEIVTYTKNYNGTYECDHTYEDLLEAYQSGVPCVAILKKMASSSGSSASAESIAPIKNDYSGSIVFATLFKRTAAGASESVTTAVIYFDRIEHKSGESITKKWTKKYTITFDA